jgi:hypothetical protein
MTMPSLDACARERARPTAVPYVELGARIHGLDGAPSRHSALLNSRNSEDTRLTHRGRAKIPRHAAFICRSPSACAASAGAHVTTRAPQERRRTNKVKCRCARCSSCRRRSDAR